MRPSPVRGSVLTGPFNDPPSLFKEALQHLSTFNPTIEAVLHIWRRGRENQETSCICCIVNHLDIAPQFLPCHYLPDFTKFDVHRPLMVNQRKECDCSCRVLLHLVHKFPSVHAALQAHGCQTENSHLFGTAAFHPHCETRHFQACQFLCSLAQEIFHRLAEVHSS